MKFEVDYRKLTTWLLPIGYRKKVHAAWLIALHSPFVAIYMAFLRLKGDSEYKVRHTGQVCKLEKVLNDSFDATEKRIYISDPPGWNDPPYLFPDTQPSKALYGPVYLYPASYYVGSDVDFIVYIPKELAINEAQEIEFRSLINYYKLPTKRYSIEYYE